MQAAFEAGAAIRSDNTGSFGLFYCVTLAAMLTKKGNIRCDIVRAFGGRLSVT